MNDDKIEVSFVIPTLNEEEYLPQCLDAVRRQTVNGKRYEIIVVDNGSTDKTVQIAKEYGARIFSAPGKTVAALRNVGARDAKGGYVAYVDADCVIDRHWLENALKHFPDEKVAAVGSPTDIVTDSTWVQKYWHLVRSKKNQVAFVKWLPTENLIVRRPALESVGGFNEALTTCEDVDFCYRLSRKYMIVSDGSVRSVHLGEARTLGEFYKKERWRGKGNLGGLFAHGLVLDELPSLLFQFYYLIAFLLLTLSAVYSLAAKDIWPLAVGLLITFSPVALLSLHTTLRAGSLKAFPPLCLLYLVYSFARVVAILLGKTIRKAAASTP